MSAVDDARQQRWVLAGMSNASVLRRLCAASADNVIVFLECFLVDDLQFRDVFRAGVFRNDVQGQVQSLQSENDDLKSQIQILKGTLLNTYSSDEINSVIEQGGLKRDISKRLDNLECLDSVNCEQVPSVKDLYGTTHSISYRFEASDTAWAKFKLDGQYDTFTANIVTSEDTNRDANMSVEIYLDDVLVGRVDDVVRDEHIRPISASVNGGNVLMIKVIRTNSCYDSHAYICDTTLSVLQ